MTIISLSHIEFFDAVEHLNKIFSPILIIYTLEIFTTNLVVLFNSVKYFIGSACSTEKPEVIYANLIWTFINVLILFQLLMATVQLCENANSVGNEVHVLYNKENTFISKEDLKYFSMQLVHCKMEFYVWGMFPFDYSLLYNVSKKNHKI